MDPLGSSIASLGLPPGVENQLTNQLNASVNGVSSSEKAEANPELKEAVSEFETVFLSLLLKEMRNTLDQSEGGLFAGESSDTYGGMFDMFMSQHLSESQPLGIAKALETYMERSAPPTPAQTVQPE